MNLSTEAPENPFSSQGHDVRRAFFFRSYRQLSPPIILLGMHRSGTSILAEMLQVLGMYIGRKLSQHSEPLFIAQLNDSLLGMAGSSWYNPRAYMEMSVTADFHQKAVGKIRESLDRGLAKQFLGLEHSFSLLAAVPCYWAFKDPRTCITIPQWLELFPAARVIHITRHPLDVAISIQTREYQRQKEGYAPIPENEDLDQALNLWELYVTAARRAKDATPNYHELRFEDLMSAPRERLEELVEFAKIEPNSGRLTTAAAMADPQRMRRYEDESYAPWRSRVQALPSARLFGYQ